MSLVFSQCTLSSDPVTNQILILGDRLELSIKGQAPRNLFALAKVALGYTILNSIGRNVREDAIADSQSERGASAPAGCTSWCAAANGQRGHRDDTHPVHAGGRRGALLIHSHQGGRCRGVVPAEGARRRCCSGGSPEGSACR